MEVKEKHKTSLCHLYSPHARYNKWRIITKELLCNTRDNQIINIGLHYHINAEITYIWFHVQNKIVIDSSPYIPLNSST